MELVKWKQFLAAQYRSIQEDMVQTENWLTNSEGDKSVLKKDVKMVQERQDLLLKLLKNTQDLMERYSIEGDYVIKDMEIKQDLFVREIRKKVQNQDAAIRRLESIVNKYRSIVRKAVPCSDVENDEDYGD